jgi:hypothetical protein
VSCADSSEHQQQKQVAARFCWLKIANHLTVPTIAQFLKSQDIDVLTDEPDRTVAHCEMDAARML